jgi:hypothetical protein
MVTMDELIKSCDEILLDEKQSRMVLKVFNNIIKDLTRQKTAAEDPETIADLDDRINKVKKELSNHQRLG